MITSEKIVLVITLWILIALIITKDTDFELFFVIVFIGVLITRALTDVFITTTLKHRMNILIYIFIIIFSIIVGNKIITILNA